MHDRTIDESNEMARTETSSDGRANRRSGVRPAVEVPPATSVAGGSMSKTTGKKISSCDNIGKRGEAERNGGGWNLPTDELSRVCKPLSVYLVRLPDTIVRKVAAPSGNKTKKKIRIARWKHGSYKKVRNRRHRGKLPSAQSNESQADENEENNISFSDAVSLSGNSVSIDSRQETVSPTGSKKSPMKNDKEKMEERAAIIETIVSGSNECDTGRSTVSTEAIARIIEPPENTQKLPLIDSTLILNSAIDSSSGERDLGESRKLFSTRDNERGNYPTLRNTAKRKSAALFESNESKDQRQLSSSCKKSKSSLPPSRSGDDATSSEINLAGETPADVAETRGVNETNSMKTAVILVNRLDDSHSPTIEKWKDQIKIRIARSKSASANPIGGSSPEPSDNDASSQPRNAESKGKSVASEANDLSTDIVMCNEDDSEEDDDEIIEFLSARRISRHLRVDSYSEIESNEEAVASPVYESESEFELSTPTRQLRNKKNNAIIVDDTSSETSSNDARRRPRTRSSCLVDNDTDQRSVKKRDASSTRGQRRATMEASDEERFTPDPVSNGQFPRRTRSRRSSSSRSWNDHHRYESVNVAQDQTQNMDIDDDDVINRNVDEENHVTLDPITVSDCSYSLAIQSSEIEDDENEDRQARNKLTAMKDAMVVLTRLEDFNYFSASNGYCNENELDANSNKDESGSESVGTSCRSGDPLEIHDSDGSRARILSLSGRESYRTIGENDEAPRSSQQSIESDYEMTLMVEDRCSQETVESDVELSLFVDECEKSPEERSNRESLAEGILTDSNGNNERVTRTSTAKSLQDTEEQRRRCDCQENERGDRHVKCQNVSAPHECARCGGTFKNYALLEQHKTSNASCNFGTRCNTCKVNFPILLDLLKHRMTCADKCSNNKPRNSLDETTNEETISESRSPEVTLSTQQPRSRDKRAKQAEKNPAKKARPKMRCRVDDLTCNVCSTNFTTKAELSEHLYKHSSGELQEAFRIAKAKAMAGSRRDKTSEENNDANLRGDVDRDASRTSHSIVDSSSGAAPSARNNGENTGLAVSADTERALVPTTRNDTSSLVTTAPAVVCPCHRDNDKASLDKTGLQIEIVLLCKYCQVLFRRRECLEVHYRTSSSCAIDRKRERWPRLFCANCRLTLNNWAEMGQHLEFHARQNSERTIRFVCNICRVVFVGFGTLLFSHWNNHSKDNGFVAGRYNFPKFSVQPKSGTEKLPAGARPDENYMFVAEHVCSRCKKPFSMRRDLDSHRASSECRGRKKPSPVESSTEETLANGVRLACDVCRVAFEDQEGLNRHGASKHGNRYTYVYDDGIISGKVASEVFKCSRCSATVPTVSAIEEHWKTRHPQRSDAILNSQNASVVTSPEKRGIAEKPPIITIDEGNNGSVRTLSDVPSAQTPTCSQNQLPLSIPVPSLITSTEFNQALDINQPAELRRVTDSADLSNRVGKPKTQTQAIEDQSTDAIVSITPTDLPPSIVAEQRNRTSDNDVSGSEVRTGNAQSSDTTALPSRERLRTSREGHVDLSNAKKMATDSTSRSPGKSTLENQKERLSNESTTIEDKENKGKDKSPSKSAGGKAIGAAASTAAPEIIDIVDDDTERRTTNDKANTGDFANAKMNVGRLRDCRKSNVPQSQPASVASMQNAAINGGLQEVSSGSDTGSTRKRAIGSSERSKVMHAAALRASRMSLEEDRWKWWNSRAASAKASDTSATRKQGFLRVKDLSELQAVKTHACSTCNAAFESEKALFEHRRSYMCVSGSFARRDKQYPRGIEAALVLPDSAERPKIPGTGSTMINAPGLPPPPSMQPISYLTQDMIGIVSSQGSQISGQCSAGFINGQASSSLILSSHNLASFPTIAQQNGNATGMVSNLVQGSSNGFFHNTTTDALSLGSNLGSNAMHNNAESQQPPQLVISSVQSIALRDPIQELGDARIAAAATAAAVASFGYHVLPPVVATPSSQQPKQTANLTTQRVSSSNYLPSSICTNNSQLMREPNNSGRFRCNICHTFRSDDIDTLNNHVTKHYTGWKNSSLGANTHQPATVAMITSAAPISIPNISSLDIRTGTSQQKIAPKSNAGADVNRCRANNPSGFNSWTVKDTPQGPVFVTPATNSTTGRQAYSSLYQSNDRPILRQSSSSSTSSSFSSSSTNNSTLNGQIVYLCKICKSALYKNYPPLRNHVLLVHGITDFGLLGLDSIAQKSYHCTQCPNTTALFDCETEYRQHVDTIHSQACPSCRRVFTNFLTLRHHLEQCRISSSSGRNSHGNNC